MFHKSLPVIKTKKMPQCSSLDETALGLKETTPIKASFLTGVLNFTLYVVSSSSSWTANKQPPFILKIPQYAERTIL